MRRILFALPICLLLPFTAFPQGGESGFATLKLGAAAREISMADAAVSSAQGPMSMHYNPALIGISGLGFTHQSLSNGLSTQFVGATAALEGYTLGFHVMYSSVDEIDVRERPGPAEGQTGAYYLSTGFTVAFPLFERFELGATAKFLFEKIYVDEATGYAFDLGAAYRPFTGGSLQDLRTGISVSNLGALSELANESTELPVLFRYGASLPVYLGSSRSRLTFEAGGITNTTAGITHGVVGAEFGYNDIAYVRAGYQSGYDNKNLVFGVGVEFTVLHFDFAYIPGKNNFGDQTALSLILAL